MLASEDPNWKMVHSRHVARVVLVPILENFGPITRTKLFHAGITGHLDCCLLILIVLYVVAIVVSVSIPGQILSHMEQVDDKIQGGDTPGDDVVFVVDADPEVQQLLRVHLVVLHQVY